MRLGRARRGGARSRGCLDASETCMLQRCTFTEFHTYPAFVSLTLRTVDIQNAPDYRVQHWCTYDTSSLAIHLLPIYLLLLTFLPPFFFPLCIAFCFSAPFFLPSPAPKLAFCLR